MRRIVACTISTSKGRTEGIRVKKTKIIMFLFYKNRPEDNEGNSVEPPASSNDEHSYSGYDKEDKSMQSGVYSKRDDEKSRATTHGVGMQNEVEESDSRIRNGTVFTSRLGAEAKIDEDDSTRGAVENGIPFTNEGFIKYGVCRADLKGEDRYDIKPIMMKNVREHDGSSKSKLFSYFAVIDGHNGQACADFTVHNMLLNIMDFVSDDALDWNLELPSAMANGFAKTHRDFASQKKLSGATCTSVIVNGRKVLVAGVGDSKAILDDGKKVHELTVDHRVDTNDSERKRILAKGGSIKRVTIGGTQHGPLRVDGTLCVSRSLGDIDVSSLVSETPDVCCVELPDTGGRLIIASDGVWDALSTHKVAHFGRKYPDDPALGCERIIKKALKAKGFRDDTTVIIVDVLPSNGSFQHCIKMPASERKTPKITLHEDLMPTSDLADSQTRQLPYEFHELEGVKVQPRLRVQGQYNSDDGFMGKFAVVCDPYTNLV